LFFEVQMSRVCKLGRGIFQGVR